MAKPNWWAIEPIEVKRARDRSALTEATRAAGAALATGDVRGARIALGKASPNSSVPKSNIRKPIGASLNEKWRLARAVTEVADNTADIGAVNRFAGKVVPGGKESGGGGNRFLNAIPKPVRSVAGLASTLANPAPALLSAATGDKSAQHEVGKTLSGESLQDSLGINTEYMDRLREKGFVGKVASAAIDTATAPLTYAGGFGAGGALAKAPAGMAKGALAKNLALKWGQEVGAGTAGMVVGGEAAEQVAQRTDNPLAIGAAALASGVVAGSAVYNPKATVKGAARVGKATGNRFLDEVDAQGGARGMLTGAEAGEVQVFRPGDKMVHATAGDFDDADVRASAGGVQNGGLYVSADAGGGMEAVGRNAEGYANNVGARNIVLTPKGGELPALILNSPVKPAELKAVRAQLTKGQRKLFDETLKSASDGNREVTGRTVKYGLEVAFGDEAAAEYAALRQSYDNAARTGGALPAITDVDAIYSKRIDEVLQKAGFPATAIKKGDVYEVAVKDPAQLEPFFDYASRPKFDAEAARQVAQNYIDNAKRINGVPAGLPPGVRTAEDIVRLQENVFNMAVEGQKGRFWYERSGKAILKMFNGDKVRANQFSQLIAAYSPSREIMPNFDLALRAYGMWAAGDPITVGSRAQQKTARAIMNGIPWEGRKTSNFYGNMLAYIDDQHPDVELLKNAVTVDRHQGTAYGFPVVKPSTNKAHSSGSVAIGKGPRYDFVEKQTQELARQLGWTGEQTQAAIWVVEKARKSKGRMTVDQASADFADALETTWAQVSWEAAPGRNTGYMPGYFDGSPMEQMEWFKQTDQAFLDEDGLDILAKEMGLVSPGEFEAPGVYKNSAGEVELNPSGQTKVALGPALKSTSVTKLEVKPEGMTVAIKGGPQKGTYEVKPGALGPIMDAEGNTVTAGWEIEGNQYAIEPAMAKAVDAYAAARVALLHQEAVGWTKPIAVQKAREGNGIAITIGRTLSADESAALALTLGEDIVIVNGEKGVWLLNLPWSGLDNESFHNVAAKGVSEVVKEDLEFDSKVFLNGGSYIEGGHDGSRAIQIIDEAGRRGAYERARAILQPRLEAIAREFDERYGWRYAADELPERYGWRDQLDFGGEAGNVSASMAADLGAGGAGALYGYATGEDTQDRWKRALAFGVGGALGAKGLQAGAKAFAPKALTTTAPPRPQSVLSALPPAQVERSYTNASGIQRVIPTVGNSRATAAVAAKQEALKNPANLWKTLPPVFANGVALLNPSITMHQVPLVAWRASQAVAAQLKTEWVALMAPKVSAVQTLLDTAVYKGPRGTKADSLIGTAKDIFENPNLYDIPTPLRQAIDDLGVSMWDDVAGRARLEYGVEVRPFEGNDPGFTYLPTISSADDVDGKIDAAFASLSTKNAAKRRGYDTARERVMNPNPRALAAGEKEFIPETDLAELVSAHIQSMATNAGNATFKLGSGGRSLGEIVEELHPGLAKQKTQARSYVTNLNSKVKTATAKQADALKRLNMNQTQMTAIEKRMQPLENRIMKLEADDEFGAELSYLSGQVRELRMMHGKLEVYAKTLEGRKNFQQSHLTTLQASINQAQKHVEDTVRAYESAGTGPYKFNKQTSRWYTPEAAKTIDLLLKVPSGAGKTLANLSDEIRAWHLAGDASLGTIQGALGVLSDPINAAKTARKMMGKNPLEEIQRLSVDEADDVAEYTFATGRQFGKPLSETRLETRGVERIKGVKPLQDQLSALFERGSYEQWKHERDIILSQNPGISRNLASHEAANMLSKVVPGLNPADRGVSAQRAALERGAVTSVSFATAPALVGAEAARGSAKLATEGLKKLMRSQSVNPDGAWAALTVREQVAVRRMTVLAGTIGAISTASAILSAESRGLSIDEAVKETLDPNSRYFMAIQLGEGRSIPLGGPFRSTIKAIVPNRDGVFFGNLPSFFGSRVNSPIKPTVEATVINRDFYGDKIRDGNLMRPENALRALWYVGDQGFAPVSVGTLSQDIRKDEFDPTGTATRVAAQFLGSNLSPVSPTEKLSQLSRARYDGKDFYDLLPSEKDAIKKANPKLWEEAVAAGSEARRAAEEQKNTLKAEQEADDDLFLNGKLTYEKWAEATDDRSNQLVGANDVLYRDPGSGAKPVSPVLDEYYQRIEDSKVRNNGRVDFDAVDEWKQSLSKGDQKLIDQNTGLNKTDLVKLKSTLQGQYYSLPRYRGYTADQAVDIDAAWQEVRNAASSSEDVAMLSAMRKLDLKLDPVIEQGVKRRILGLLAEDTSRANWAKAHPEAQVFLRRGKLTQGDRAAILSALKKATK